MIKMRRYFFPLFIGLFGGIMIGSIALSANAFEVKYVNFSDKVSKLENQDQDPGQRSKVLFKRHAGVYYLSKGNPHYKTLLATLQESLKNGEVVLVTADPTTLLIETATAGNEDPKN